MIFANKQDLAGASSVEELREILDLDSIATHHCFVIACSAVTGENLEKGMDWIVNDVASRIFTLA